MLNMFRMLIHPSSGPVQACNGIALLLIWQPVIIISVFQYGFITQIQIWKQVEKFEWNGLYLYCTWTFFFNETELSLCDFRLAPRCEWDLSLFWGITLHIFVFSDVSIQWSSSPSTWTTWPFNMGSTGCPETSVTSLRCCLWSHKSDVSLQIWFLFIKPFHGAATPSGSRPHLLSRVHDHTQTHHSR